MMIWDLALST